MKKRAFKSSIAVLLLICLVFPCLVFPPLPAAAGPQMQWTDLVTGVDANGDPTTVRVYGYYTEAKGFGQVFVVCDPNTGKETGDAYVPGAKVGEKQGRKLVGYERRQDLDWDNPKQVNPPRVGLTAPNIPTDTRWDIEHYRQTGQLVRKTENRFVWPMSYSFARMIPGSDPNYWLIVAAVENPNPFPATVEANHLRISEWRNQFGGWWGISNPHISYQGKIPLGPNETKYVLLNSTQRGYYLARELWLDWPSPGYSDAYYFARMISINDPDYPDALKSRDRHGFFVPYVRWDGTEPTVLPVIPMRLAFQVSCHGVDRQGNAWSDPLQGRGWPQMWGRVEHDPKTGEWSVNISLSDRDKPWWWTDDRWRAYKTAAETNARRTLSALFAKWYPKVPYRGGWGRESVYADGITGEYYGTKLPSPNPQFYVEFRLIEPVPPSGTPRPPGWPWSNTRYGGWLYTTRGPWSSGFELTAPVLFRYNLRDPIPEFNYQSYSARDRDGDVDVVHVPRGTGIHRRADVNYYDRRWMDNLPVLESRSMFVEQRRFVATDGQFGYLKKEAVPGYLLWVDVKQRPVLDVATQPAEVRARCGYVDRRDGADRGVWREWRWTPEAGWEYRDETVGQTRGLSRETAVWELTFGYGHTVSGSNPTDFPVSWTGRWGGTPSLYWPGTDTLRAKIADMADKERVETHDRWGRVIKVEYVPRVDYVNVDAAIPLPGVPSLAARDESKQLASCEKTANARFWKSPIRNRRTHESWDTFQNRVLGEIASNIIRPVLSSQEEAVFNGGGRFVMTPTFEAGKGGVIGGAQRYLVGYYYRYESKWDWWVFDDLGCWKIGFPNADITLRSYVSTASPTQGLVVKGNDEYLVAARSGGWTQIRFDRNAPVGERMWRFYDERDRRVYPPPYPDD